MKYMCNCISVSRFLQPGCRKFRGNFPILGCTMILLIRRPLSGQCSNRASQNGVTFPSPSLECEIHMYFGVEILAARLQKILRKFSHSGLHDDFAPKMVLFFSISPTSTMLTYVARSRLRSSRDRAKICSLANRILQPSWRLRKIFF